MSTSAADNNKIHVDCRLFVNSIVLVLVVLVRVLRAYQQWRVWLLMYVSTLSLSLSRRSPDAQFVRVAPLSETDNPEDDKVYVFFTERAQEAEGAGGKVLYSRVARVCKVRRVFICLLVCVSYQTPAQARSLFERVRQHRQSTDVPDCVCVWACGGVCLHRK